MKPLPPPLLLLTPRNAPELPELGRLKDDVAGRALPFVYFDTIRGAGESASVTVSLPVSGGFKLRNGTERNGRRAGEFVRCFEVGRGRGAEWSAAD